jgi:hypothetical protein
MGRGEAKVGGKGNDGDATEIEIVVSAPPTFPWSAGSNEPTPRVSSSSLAITDFGLSAAWSQKRVEGRSRSVVALFCLASTK